MYVYIYIFLVLCFIIIFINALMCTAAVIFEISPVGRIKVYMCIYIYIYIYTRRHICVYFPLVDVIIILPPGLRVALCLERSPAGTWTSRTSWTGWRTRASPSGWRPPSWWWRRWGGGANNTSRSIHHTHESCLQAPESYKNVTDVVNTCHEAGISKKAIKLRPIAVIKG